MLFDTNREINNVRQILANSHHLLVIALRKFVGQQITIVRYGKKIRGILEEKVEECFSVEDVNFDVWEIWHIADVPATGITFYAN